MGRTMGVGTQDSGRLFRRRSALRMLQMPRTTSRRMSDLLSEL